MGIYDVISFSEATELWGLKDSTLRKMANTDRLRKYVDYRKSGKTWLITVNAMVKLYGKLGVVNMLKKRIEEEIKRKYWDAGHMGSESVCINLQLTDEEKEEFLKLSDIYDYDLDGNSLSILFSEDGANEKKIKSI